MADFKVYGSTVNYLKNPCGIDENPSFSYKLSSGERGGAQKSRRICVKEALTGNVVWDSGVVETKEQLFVSYAGEKLKPITKYEFTVEAVRIPEKLLRKQEALLRVSSALSGRANGSMQNLFAVIPMRKLRSISEIRLK